MKQNYLWRLSVMNFDQLKYSIERGDIKPIYWLDGDEPYFIDEITSYFTDRYLDVSERDFNQDVLYGRDTDPGVIMEMARQFPMMAEKRLVVVKEAQAIDARKLDDLTAYAKSPVETTVLVFAYKGKKLDKRKGLAKAISKTGVHFTAQKLYPNQVADWATKFLHHKKYDITSNAAQLLAEYLGTDLGKIANELNKLMINLEPGHKVNGDDIEKYIGISKDYNVFELINALGNRNISKANTIAKYMGDNIKDNPLPMVLSLLATFFGKVMAIHFEKTVNRTDIADKLGMSMYILNDYMAAYQNYPASKIFENISLIRDYDMRSKGVNSGDVTDSELLRELIYLLMH